jgi:hypothetical protein
MYCRNDLCIWLTALRDVTASGNPRRDVDEGTYRIKSDILKRNSIDQVIICGRLRNCMRAIMAVNRPTVYLK